VSEQAPDGNGGRLVACRACGNRVARAARRCPACGAREPTGAVVEAAAADEAPPRPAPRERGPWPGLLASALTGAAAAALVSLLLRPGPAPVEQRPAPPAPVVTPEAPREAAAPPPPVEAAPPLPPAPSRSRGRKDWIFFFKPGDRLARMGNDDAELGMVIRLEKAHTFPDGTTGPAYLLQVPEGGQRFLDADELERGARIQ
jgi:hypothetical protein